MLLSVDPVTIAFESELLATVEPLIFPPVNVDVEIVEFVEVAEERVEFVIVEVAIVEFVEVAEVIVELFIVEVAIEELATVEYKTSE